MPQATPPEGVRALPRTTDVALGVITPPPLHRPDVSIRRVRQVRENESPLVRPFHYANPPATPGALSSEPLAAAVRGPRFAAPAIKVTTSPFITKDDFHR
jgi:hypothetical protein